MRALRYFRALFPSWRFFDRVVASPRLLVRYDDGAWQPIDSAPRPAGTALFAPRANLALAYQSVVDQLVHELGELDLEGEAPDDGIERDPRVTTLVTYELVGRIARSVVPAGARYQWKVVLSPGPAEPDAPDADPTYIVSPELAA